MIIATGLMSWPRGRWPN